VLCLACSAQAQTRINGFDDPELDAEYRGLIHSLRCMLCQNQSVADSTADQAQDIRRRAYDLMAQGNSPEETREYLVSRYGDFITYKPPFKPSTWLLWAAPALFLIAGGWIFARVLQRRMQEPLDEELL
jgi:cytochrome c-type biogenesis protein CcmH